MTLYLVNRVVLPYGYRTMIGTFDSKEKAIQAADWLNKHSNDLFSKFEVGRTTTILNKIDKDTLRLYGIKEVEEWVK